MSSIFTVSGISKGAPQVTSPRVSYEEAPVAELELDGVSYRVDPGQGSAVAVSSREVGTWDWQLVAEGRWDGVLFKAKGLDHVVVSALGRLLKEELQSRTE